MIYLIDNGQECSSHAIHFVEALPGEIEPLLALMSRAWLRQCQRCGDIVPAGTRSRCSEAPIDGHYFYPSLPFVVAICDAIEWRTGKPQTLADWLDSLSVRLTSEVADVEAARAFHAMVGELAPNVYLGRVESYELRPEIKTGKGER